MLLCLLALMGCEPPPDDVQPEPEHEPHVVFVPPPPAESTLTTPAPKEPSLLFISIDTLRYDHIGGNGETRPLTPNLDAFADTTVRYTQARSHTSWTKSSMGTVMTSQLAASHGLHQWEDALDPTAPTLATTLDAAGFNTEGAVSHSAFDPDVNEFHHGFDRFDISSFSTRGYPADFLTSEEVTDVALERLDALLARPRRFMLWVHYFDPHTIYFDHDALLDLGTTPRDRYGEEIAFTDLHLGRLLDRIADHENVVVVVVGDHGEEFGDHGDLGHGHTVFDELVHVPLFLRAPGLEPGVEEGPVRLIDLSPTLLHLLGVEPPDTFTGQPFLPAPHDLPLFMDLRRRTDLRGVVDGQLKLVWELTEPPGSPVLFDLASDPGETTNLAPQRPIDTGRLTQLLIETYPELTP